VWALLYFPRGDGAGGTYDARVSALRKEIKDLKTQVQDAEDETAKEKAEKAVEDKEDELNEVSGTWKRQSLLGRMGHAIEPVVRPLGWDWKIGMAALASFPAREVVVGTLGLIYDLGKVEADEIAEPLGNKLRKESWDDGSGRKVFTVPVALSLMVFFALCCQCASTLAVIKRETNSWRWPLFTFAYMTILAYVGALVVYQVGSLLARC
jgi:ferrous iron transport protein B